MTFWADVDTGSKWSDGHHDLFGNDSATDGE
jgi:hypothetical protein